MNIIRKIFSKSRSLEDGIFFDSISKILGFEPKTIDYYKKAVEHMGGELLLPIRGVVDSNEIKAFSYAENVQLPCMFKQSGTGLEEQLLEEEAAVRGFFEEFAIPLMLKLMSVPAFVDT